MKHYNITVHGRVQGVFFRASTKGKAEELGLTGWVKNQPDGTVYIEVEGSKGDLDEFVNWCKKGPASAEVDQVDVKEGAVMTFGDFKIKRF